ncbi:hypothetical protein GCM10023238_26220 [Streptomyces heliomycini]
MTGGTAELRWTAPEVILEAGIEPVDPAAGVVCRRAARGTTRCTRRTVSRAVATGLRCRPVAETVADTCAGCGRSAAAARPTPGPPARRAGREVEAKVLAGPGV